MAPLAPNVEVLEPALLPQNVAYLSEFGYDPDFAECSRYSQPFSGVFVGRVSVQTAELVQDEARCVGGDSVVLSGTSLLRLRTL